MGACFFLNCFFPFMERFYKAGVVEFPTNCVLINSLQGLTLQGVSKRFSLKSWTLVNSSTTAEFFFIEGCSFRCTSIFESKSSYDLGRCLFFTTLNCNYILHVPYCGTLLDPFKGYVVPRFSSFLCLIPSFWYSGKCYKAREAKPALLWTMSHTNVPL